jgi:hypothetical protein
MPALLSAIYFAWRQMLGGEGATKATPVVTGIEA